MCLALVAHRAHPRYALVLAANRDEFHARPASPLHWWDDGRPLLAGRDLAAGGTWCGLDRRGRLALVTNYRDPSLPRPQGRTRGALVPEFLRADRGAAEFVRQAAAGAAGYAGFSLMALDDSGLHYTVSHPVPEVLALEPGIHGLSNRRIDDPWPKLLRARSRFEGELKCSTLVPARLFEILSDRTTAGDASLPDTGIGLEWERLLSSPFIVSPEYGTRCSTVVLIDGDGRIDVEERSYSADGTAFMRVRISYLQDSPA